MLVAPGRDKTFPDDKYTYVAFLVAAREVDQFFLKPEVPRDHRSNGFCRFVPLMWGVLPEVQLDLIGEVWVRHRAERVHEASLLDAAILYAICRAAAENISQSRYWVRHWVELCPLDLIISLSRRTQERLLRRYARWWPGFDPSQLQSRELLEGYTAAQAGPVYAALKRKKVQPTIATNLQEFFRPWEIETICSTLGLAKPNREDA
jgi:hypothetical protein